MLQYEAKEELRDKHITLNAHIEKKIQNDSILPPQKPEKNEQMKPQNKQKEENSKEQKSMKYKRQNLIASYL